MEFHRWGWLLLTLVPAFVQAALSPGILEVDMIYPRNETFAPSGFTPIVFAIQNPTLFQTLNPILKWTIDQLEGDSNDRVRAGESFSNLTAVQNSNSSVFFLSVSTHRLDREGTWEFKWNLRYTNCSKPGSADVISYNNNHTEHSFIFTTENGAPPTDLVAATDSSTCARSQALAWNITDVLPVPAPWQYGGAIACPVIPSMTLVPSPCNARIDEPAAASITAALVEVACRSASPTVPCPGESNAAVPGLGSPGWRMWVPMMLGSVAYAIA